MLAIWQQPLDAEIAAKSKYAKYHALRIAKALKAGEDPNLSNPKTEPEPSEGLPTSPPVLDPNDPEVQRINHPNAYHQPSVESASQSNPTSPPLPPLSGPLPPHDISPISPPDDIPTRSSAAGEPSSPGGGYFPRVPTFTSETSASTLPTAPAEETLPDPSPSIPTQLPQPPQAQQPQAHQPPQPPRQPQFSSSQTFAPTSDSTSPASFYQQPSLPQPPAVPPTQSFPQPSYSQPPVVPQPPLPPAPAQSAFNPSPAAATRYQPDEDAMMSAQKHAKWAISALNFEDVDTAVRELRAALHELTGN
jgi:vacuolar protein sorting-associated protein VTA1